ncbi:MAG: IS1595 family transposase [Desulfomonilaceae bacterium]
MQPEKLNLSQATEMNEEQARQYIESVLWSGGPCCPHCGSEKAWDIRSASARSGVYECAACGKQFTVTVGTVMHGSHIPLRQWLIAFHLMTSSKKGVSALQLQRNLGLGSYRTAWYLAHRIRLSMNEDAVLKMLKGTVEVDETYVGGKPRKENKGGSGTSNSEPKKKSKRGRGTDKAPVLALVERKGKVFSKPIEHVDAKTLKGAIKELVHKDSTIMTDEWASYTGIGKDFKGGHEVVKHSDGEFMRGFVSTNTVESYFALLKRRVHGIFHHVSKHHLHRYCNEFSFRWNHRKVDDGERMIAVIKGCEGKRLSYKPLVGTMC